MSLKWECRAECWMRSTVGCNLYQLHIPASTDCHAHWPPKEKPIPAEKDSLDFFRAAFPWPPRVLVWFSGTFLSRRGYRGWSFIGRDLNDASGRNFKQNWVYSGPKWHTQNRHYPSEVFYMKRVNITELRACQSFDVLLLLAVQQW